MKKYLPLFLLAFAAVCAPLPAYAQDGDDDAPAKEEKAEPSEDDKKAEEYAEAIEGLTRIDGPFPMFQKGKKILLEIDEANLERLFLMQATLRTGINSDFQAGDPLNDYAIGAYKFRKFHETIQVIKPNLKYRTPANDPLAIAAARSLPEAIIANLDIEATDPKAKKILVDAASLFDGDVIELETLVEELVDSSYSSDSSNSGPISIKGFPANSVVTMQSHFRKSSSEGGMMSLIAMLLGLSEETQNADNRSLPLEVTYNLWFYQPTSYQPRYADPRVGYFTTDYFDVGKMKEVDRKTELIQRFDLRKKDPNAALSEPIKPIVWTLDPSIPEEYKDGVRQGILFWNKAFEKVGFKNAMVVQDAPDDPDYNHADGRYNVIRWTFTPGTAYAVAQARNDPFTGEILSAAITVDANYPASTVQEYNEQVMGDPRTDLLTADQRKRLNTVMTKFGWQRKCCNHAHGKFDQARTGWALISATGAAVSMQEYTNSMLADLIAHEVGHTLGLRHNFAASTQLSVNDLTNDALLQEKAIAASVMDYTPINLAAILHGGKTYWNPTLGAYDYWAIEYGYRQAPGMTPETERTLLQTIAAKSGLPGHIYLTDEDSNGVNPLASTWDLGNDSLEYLKLVSDGSDRLREYAITRATKHGETYTRRNALIMRSIRQRYSNAQFAVQMVGGVEFRRHLLGDVGEKPTLRPVAPARQREAMKQIAKDVLMHDSVDLPQEILYGLSQNPTQGGAEYIAPLRSYIGAQQSLVVLALTSPDKCAAILENEFKTRDGSQPYTLGEHFSMLYSAVFTELSAKQAVGPLRRDLQSTLLDAWAAMYASGGIGVNNDIRLLAGKQLTRIQQQAEDALESPLVKDEMTRLHLEDLVERVDRAFDFTDE